MKFKFNIGEKIRYKGGGEYNFTDSNIPLQPGDIVTISERELYEGKPCYGFKEEGKGIVHWVHVETRFEPTTNKTLKIKELLMGTK